MSRPGWWQYWQVLPLIAAVSGTPASASPSVEAPGYVGSSACQACHAGQFEAWTGSHHDLAMQPATESTVLGDFDDATLDHLGITSRFYRNNGKFYVHTEGQDGEFDEYEIKYVFGVRPLQQYLVEFPRGRFQCLPLCWDTRPEEDGGQRWFHLYPIHAPYPR